MNWISLDQSKLCCSWLRKSALISTFLWKHRREESRLLCLEVLSFHLTFSKKPCAYSFPQTGVFSYMHVTKWEKVGWKSILCVLYRYVHTFSATQYPNFTTQISWILVYCVLCIFSMCVQYANISSWFVQAFPFLPLILSSPLLLPFFLPQSPLSTCQHISLLLCWLEISQPLPKCPKVQTLNSVDQ